LLLNATHLAISLVTLRYRSNFVYDGGMSNTRSKLLAVKSFRREKTIFIDVPGDNGSKVKMPVLIVSPSVGDRNRLAAGMGASDIAKMDPSRLTRAQATVLVACMLDPESRAPLFTSEDLEALESIPAGSWFDDAFSAVMDLVNEESEGAKADFPTPEPN